jgi:hypothetical protein
MTAVVLGPMILSGYLIQAITHQGWLRAMVISHIVIGVLYSVGLLAHQFAAGGRAARAERSEARRGLHAARLQPARQPRDHTPAG